MVIPSQLAQVAAEQMEACRQVRCHGRRCRDLHAGTLQEALGDSAQLQERGVRHRPPVCLSWSDLSAATRRKPPFLRNRGVGRTPRRSASDCVLAFEDGERAPGPIGRAAGKESEHHAGHSGRRGGHTEGIWHGRLARDRAH